MANRISEPVASYERTLCLRSYLSPPEGGDDPTLQVYMADMATFYVEICSGDLFF